MSIKLLFCILTFLSASYGKTGFGPGEQDYGYVTVRQGAHMFWWLHHTTANVTDSSERPLILFLMGGPGGSGTADGNFGLVGLIDYDLVPRKNSWVRDFNILFIDNPVGVGYSYVEDFRYLANNNTQIAIDLVEVMKGFFSEIPKFKKVPFYVYGISYGGKMGTDFVRLLYDEIKQGHIECNLKGLSMGNAWISPIDSTISYGPFLYQMGLIDETGLSILNFQAQTVKSYFDQGQLYLTCLSWFRLMNTITAVTDGVDIYNVLTKVPKWYFKGKGFDEYLKRSFTNFIDVEDVLKLMNGPVKEALGIPSYVFWQSQSSLILQNLFEDFMMPVTNTMESILNDTDIQVHVCNGNVDLIVDTPGVLIWINKLKWKNSGEFHNAKRTTMWVNNTMEGYIKRGGNLNFYWINVAGHNAITENPAATRAFLESITGF